VQGDARFNCRSTRVMVHLVARSMFASPTWTASSKGTSSAVSILADARIRPCIVAPWTRRGESESST
jgi:hypothetical protein